MNDSFVSFCICSTLCLSNTVCLLQVPFLLTACSALITEKCTATIAGLIPSHCPSM